MSTDNSKIPFYPLPADGCGFLSPEMAAFYAKMSRMDSWATLHMHLSLEYTLKCCEAGALPAEQVDDFTKLIPRYAYAFALAMEQEREKVRCSIVPETTRQEPVSPFSPVNSDRNGGRFDA